MAVNGHKLDFVIFTIQEVDKKNTIKVACTSPDEEGKTDPCAENFKNVIFPGFLKKMEEFIKSPCYVTLDFRYVFEGSNRDKLVLISWCPDNAKIKERMLAGASFQRFAGSLGGSFKKVEAHSLGDITYDAILEIVLKI